MGLLEPLTCLKLQVRSRGPGLCFVQECLLDKTFPGILADYSRMEWAGHLLALWLRVFPQDQAGDGEAAFRLLRVALEGLDLGFDAPWVVSWCEAQLFLLLGLQPQLDSCVRCGAADLTAFSSRAGGGLCSLCGQQAETALPPWLRAWMRFLHRASLKAAVGGRPRQEEVMAVRRLHEDWLHYHLPGRTA